MSLYINSGCNQWPLFYGWHFPSMKIIAFWFKFRWSFFPRVRLTNWFQVQYTMLSLMMAWCFQWKPFYSLPHYKGLVYELISPKTKMPGISKSISLNKTWEIDENIQWVLFPMALTHWGWVTNICISKLGHHWFKYNNGLSPDRPQAIIRTNAGIMLIEPLRTNFSELLI